MAVEATDKRRLTCTGTTPLSGRWRTLLTLEPMLGLYRCSVVTLAPRSSSRSTGDGAKRLAAWLHCYSQGKNSRGGIKGCSLLGRRTYWCSAITTGSAL